MMKHAILYNWNFFRALRLILGIIIIVQAVMSREWIFGIAGLFFAGMALFNQGCCGTGACSIPIKKDLTINKEITYEEVD
jgi:hypothetical protein